MDVFDVVVWMGWIGAWVGCGEAGTEGEIDRCVYVCLVGAPWVT